MSARAFGLRLLTAAREVRAGRLLLLVVIPLAIALASDWLREERVIFPAPLPAFTTVPARP